MRGVGPVKGEPQGACAGIPVVVCDGDTRPALAAVRSLGAAGCEVHVLASRAGSLAGVSRYTAAEHLAPGVEDDPDGWIAAVESLLASLPGAVLMPVTEASLGTLFAFDLPARRDVIAPPAAAYATAVDKHALGELAAACGLAVPQSVLVEAPSELAELPPGMAFPVVVKARRSRWLAAGRWHSGGVHLARSARDLSRIAGDPGLGAGALVQEFVPGHGEGLFFLAEQGEIRARFAHRRLREKPPSGGVSVLCESIALDPELEAASRRLLKELAWNGVAMVEFRRAPDGRAVLMEINPRLWGSLQLAIDAGVDFPRAMLALHRGEAVPDCAPRLGVRNRWLLGDVDHLWIALRRPEMRRAMGKGVAGVVWAFLASFFDGSRLEVLRRDDPRPFWAELRRWLF